MPALARRLRHLLLAVFCGAVLTAGAVTAAAAVPDADDGPVGDHAALPGADRTMPIAAATLLLASAGLAFLVRRSAPVEEIVADIVWLDGWLDRVYRVCADRRLGNQRWGSGPGRPRRQGPPLYPTETKGLGGGPKGVALRSLRDLRP